MSSSDDNKKRNIWVSGVLVVVVAVFVLFTFSPLLTTILNSSPSETATTPEEPVTPSADDLEVRAQGYEAVLEREPDNISALQGLLEIRLQQGDLPNAIVPLEALADLQPEQTRFRIALAQAKQQLGDLEGSEAAYRQLLETEPSELFALQGLVALLVQQGRVDEAASEVQNVLEIAQEVNAGEDVEVIPVRPVEYLLAQVYTVQQRWDDAIAIYDRAAAEDESDFRPILGKAIALQEQGDPEAAKPLFEKAYATAPANFQPQIAQIGGLEVEAPTPTQIPSAPAAPAPEAPPAAESE